MGGCVCMVGKMGTYMVANGNGFSCFLLGLGSIVKVRYRYSQDWSFQGMFSGSRLSQVIIEIMQVDADIL